MNDWWKSFFKPSVYPLAELVSDEETEKETRELLRRLPLKKGAEILDVACGVGRHSLSLSRKGYLVTGVDYSEGYLAEAKRRARAAGIQANFLKRDMRALGFSGQFDAALNLWTSFGYFKKFQDDLLTLRQIFKSLKPGGFLVLDIADGRWLKRHAKQKDWIKTERGWELEEHRFRGGTDPAWISRWVFIGKNGKVSEAESFSRHYDRKRLEKALRWAGFENIVLMGGLSEKRNAGLASQRIMALARRPCPRVRRPCPRVRRPK